MLGLGLQNPPRARQDARLRVKVRAFFEASAGRVWEDLLEDGDRVSRKRVVRMMQTDGLQAPTSRESS